MNRWLALLFFSGLSAQSALAGAGSVSFAIPLEAATRAVLAAHPDLAGDAIELPARIETRQPSPVLKAGPIERMAASAGLGNPVAHVRLSCQAGACLPFYVLVHLSPSPIQEPAIPAVRLSSAPSRFAAVREQNTPPVRMAEAPTLRSGAHASMVIDSGLLHIRVAVTCLQSGSTGSTIRVAGLGRRKVYEAAIVDGTTVRGSL